MKLFGRKINEYKINWKNNGQQKVKKIRLIKKEIYTCIDPGNSLIKKELVMKVKKKGQQLPRLNKKILARIKILKFIDP